MWQNQLRPNYYGRDASITFVGMVDEGNVYIKMFSCVE